VLAHGCSVEKALRVTDAAVDGTSRGGAHRLVHHLSEAGVGAVLAAKPRERPGEQ